MTSTMVWRGVRPSVSEASRWPRSIASMPGAEDLGEQGGTLQPEPDDGGGERVELNRGQRVGRPK